ncbi:MAG: esterase-like activity of phytase family protein [Gammaproteobacteria bacterium]|nr:esterase-like activity of phytase family protein [Gammaproteobacteria bacterium]
MSKDSRPARAGHRPRPFVARFATLIMPIIALLHATAAAPLLAAGTDTGSGRSIARPVDFWAEHEDDEAFMGVRLHGAIKINPVEIDGLRVAGLSALAYDEDEDILYAASDRGVLFHFRPLVRDGHLRDLVGLAAYRLQDPGARAPGVGSDAEGMEIVNGRNGQRGDARLVVSFERQPRVLLFTPQGRVDGRLVLPPGLDRNRYFRNRNAGIESITLHPRHGWLAAPEKAKSAEGAQIVPLRTLDGRNSWPYRLADEPNAALVALEAWPDGRLLALERAYGPLYLPIVNTLRLVRLAETNGAAPSIETVARFDSSRGWLADNFEGLTRYKAQDFFIVSDDNENILQANLLVYLELLR